MSELTKTGGSGLTWLLHNQDNGLTIPQPFERDIFLFSTSIAGTTHIEGLEDLEPHIHLEDRLNFYREPDNPYDPKAIVIKNEDGIKLGYVPKADNAIFSRLMDAGKLLFAKVVKKEWIDGYWLKIDVDIYLHE